MLRFFFLILLATCSLSSNAEEISLKQTLSVATVGSYIVTEQNKTFTLLHIYDRRGTKLFLEEVAIPSSSFSRFRCGWKEWFESGAPDNTSWTLSQINLETAAFEESYSFTHGGWMDCAQEGGFLTTLLNLRFERLPDPERRKIGLPPGFGKPDYRPLWNPRLVVNGATIRNAAFSVWKGRWPTDGSELSHKNIEIYLPETADPNPPFPTYFPYWIEVEGKIANAKVRVVDSGFGAISPKNRLPRRPLGFIEGVLEQDYLVFKITNPSHLSEFVILAQEAGSFSTKATPLCCHTQEIDETTFLSISKEELEKNLMTGMDYTFLITPQEAPHLALEITQHLIF